MKIPSTDSTIIIPTQIYAQQLAFLPHFNGVNNLMTDAKLIKYNNVTIQKQRSTIENHVTCIVCKFVPNHWHWVKYIVLSILLLLFSLHI